MSSSLLTILTVISLYGQGHAPARHPPDVASLTKSAERVVVATIVRVEPIFQRNEFGDELIVSRTHVRVDENLKDDQEASTSLIVEVEGGSIGDLTLEVSDLPKVRPGDRAIFFLTRTSRGTHVPQGRGAGILKLDAQERVHGAAVSLTDVKAAVRQAR